MFLIEGLEVHEGFPESVVFTLHKPQSLKRPLGPVISQHLSHLQCLSSGKYWRSLNSIPCFLSSEDLDWFLLLSLGNAVLRMTGILRAWEKDLWLLPDCCQICSFFFFFLTLLLPFSDLINGFWWSTVNKIRFGKNTSSLSCITTINTFCSICSYAKASHSLFVMDKASLFRNVKVAIFPTGCVSLQSQLRNNTC